MDDENEEAPSIGRRERKRRETRRLLSRAALDLFAEKGFDAVTVAEIAERADVDKSTFFRHFSSKESVIFADYADFAGRLGDALRRRPDEEPLLEAVEHAVRDLVADLMVNIDDEVLRYHLSIETPEVSAHALAAREELIVDFAAAIAERLSVSVEEHPGPYLLAAAWVLTANWYRGRAVRLSITPASADAAVEEIAALVAELGPLLAVGPTPGNGRA